jgi:hypothetical protein
MATIATRPAGLPSGIPTTTPTATPTTSPGPNAPAPPPPVRLALPPALTVPALPSAERRALLPGPRPRPSVAPEPRTSVQVYPQVEDLRDRIAEETRSVLGPLALYLLVLVSVPFTAPGAERYAEARLAYLATSVAAVAAAVLLCAVLAHRWFLAGTAPGRGLRGAVILELVAFGFTAVAAALGVVTVARLLAAPPAVGLIGAVVCLCGAALAEIAALDGPARWTVVVRRTGA